MRYLVVPGIDDSGPDHWQSVWQAGWGRTAVRIAPASFSEPDLDDWVDQLERLADPDTVVVAHSLGCLAVSAWLGAQPGAAAGAFLVAPPDPAGPRFPTSGPTFRDADTRFERPLGTPAVVVGSTDDPYCSVEVTRARVATWRAAYVELGPFGHLNANAVGDWPAGRHLLTAFVAGLDLG